MSILNKPLFFSFVASLPFAGMALGQHADHDGSHEAPALPADASPDSKHAQGMPPKPDSSMSHSLSNMKMQGGSAPEDARDPDAYSNGYTLHSGPYLVSPETAHMHGTDDLFWAVQMDRLEQRRSPNERPETAYETDIWLGTSYDKALMRLEGKIEANKLADSTNEILWAHAISTFWDMILGVNYEAGDFKGKGSGAFGVKGLAPYWFESEITVYIGEGQDWKVRSEFEYELLFTQKLILTPRLEFSVANKGDPERGLGSGLREGALGMRLRYEFIRRFGPYLGIEREQSFAETARIAKAKGKNKGQTDYLGGVRFWF